MELIRKISDGYEMSTEEFQEALDVEIKTHKKAIEICKQEQLTEILKDSLIELQDLKIQEGIH